jgi:hypothetical protein
MKSDIIYTLILVSLFAVLTAVINYDKLYASTGDDCNGTMCTQTNCAFFGLVCDGVCSPVSPWGDCEYTGVSGNCIDTGCTSPAVYNN